MKMVPRAGLGWDKNFPNASKSIEPVLLWSSMNAATRTKRPTCVETR
jgi:hypothetical protein